MLLTKLKYVPVFFRVTENRMFSILLTLQCYLDYKLWPLESIHQSYDSFNIHPAGSYAITAGLNKCHFKLKHQSRVVV